METLLQCCALLGTLAVPLLSEPMMYIYWNHLLRASKQNLFQALQFQEAFDGFVRQLYHDRYGQTFEPIVELWLYVMHLTVLVGMTHPQPLRDIILENYNDAIDGLLARVLLIQRSAKRIQNRIGAIQSRVRCQGRSRLLKEEIVMAVFHPKNVARWLNEGGDDLLFMMFSR